MIAMVTMMDGLIFKVGPPIKNPTTGMEETKGTKPLKAQLSTKELLSFKPSDDEFFDRRLIDGPLYGRECLSLLYMPVVRPLLLSL